jgi:signal peptidase I
LLTGFQRFSNQGNFFGYRIYTVASGSMIPIYNIGDTLLIEEMDASKIKVGDAVTYMGDEAGVDGMIITHQVIDVQKDENGRYLFQTKGIANDVVDPIISEEQVLGKVIHKFFFLSFLGKITTNMTSMLVFITVPIAFLIALEIIKLVYKDDIEEIKSSMKSNDEPNTSDEPDDESKVVNEEINHIEDGKEEKTEEQNKE